MEVDIEKGEEVMSIARRMFRGRRSLRSGAAVGVGVGVAG